MYSATACGQRGTGSGCHSGCQNRAHTRTRNWQTCNDIEGRMLKKPRPRRPEASRPGSHSREMKATARTAKRWLAVGCGLAAYWSLTGFEIIDAFLHPDPKHFQWLVPT